MAKDKKGFVLYCDLIHTAKKLPQEQQAKLFIHILEYVNDLNPETDDILVEISFEPIKQQLKRDLKKYEKRAENSRNNGKLGGRPKNPKKPSGLNQNPDKPKKPDTVTVTVTDTVTDKDTVNDILLKKETKDFSFNNEVIDCFENCLQHFPKHLQPDNLKKRNTWLKTIDQLNRIDKIDFKTIENVVKETRADDFWAQNFLSLTKLRKKNKDGLFYIVVFNERLKTKQNGSSTTKKGISDEEIQRFINS